MLRADARILSAWLRDATVRLDDAGVEAARNDAERLAAHGLGCSWGDLWMRSRGPIDSEEGSKLNELLDRRCAGEPLGYVVGSVVFCGIELECGPGVLVPRPETETLVDVALELIAGRKDPVVLDIGTGTAAVAIAIARARPDAHVTATDMSARALDYAKRNVGATGVKVRLLAGDLFAALPGSLRGRIDVVVSNPPYVASGASLPKDVSAEPHDALRAGPTGNELLHRIADDAPGWLTTDGALALEFGTADQAAGLHLAAFTDVGIRDDHTTRPRVVWARR